MQCTVYKSLEQQDYYLYVEAGDDFSCLPDGLVRMLGRLEKVVELDLHENRQLARVDARQVMQQLADQGYYLQMPSTEPHPLDT